MALRALKTDEEIAAIPLDQEILVELPGGVIDEEQTEPEKPSKPEKAEPDGAKVLQEQLEAAQRAQAASDARAERAEREAAEARRLATEADKRTASLEGDVITGGLAAAQAEVASAKQALQVAGEAGDYKAMADAQERIGRAAAKVLHFESGAAEIAERPKGEPRQEQVLQKPLDPILAVDSNPNLLPAEKEWLKAHPDAVVDGKRNNELGVAYERAIKKDLVRGTPAYFAFLEEFMGYKQPDTNNGETNVSAPPSRNERGGDGRPSPNRITLTPEQREIAKSMGVTDIEYARQVQAFEQARKADPEKYQGR
jgi:hypothetical protein